MKLSELTKRVREYENDLAEGSETALWGDYLARMDDVTGVMAYHEDADGVEGVEVPDDEAAWWLKAYEIFAASNCSLGFADLSNRVDMAL